MPHDDNYYCMKGYNLNTGEGDKRLSLESYGISGYGHNPCCDDNPLVCIKGPFYTELGGGDCVGSSDYPCCAVGMNPDLLDQCKCQGHIGICGCSDDPGDCIYETDIPWGNDQTPWWCCSDSHSPCPRCSTGGGDVVASYIFTFTCDASYLVVSGTLGQGECDNTHPCFLNDVPEQWNIPGYNPNEVGFYSAHPFTSPSGGGQGSVPGGAGTLKITSGIGTLVDLKAHDPVGPFPGTGSACECTITLPDGTVIPTAYEGWESGSTVGCGSPPFHPDCPDAPGPCGIEAIAPNGYRATILPAVNAVQFPECDRQPQYIKRCVNPTCPCAPSFGHCACEYCEGGCNHDACCNGPGQWTCEDPPMGEGWQGIIESTGVNDSIGFPGPAIIDISEYRNRAVVLTIFTTAYHVIVGYCSGGAYKEMHAELWMYPANRSLSYKLSVI